jgi:hypothetical protein
LGEKEADENEKTAKNYETNPGSIGEIEDSGSDIDDKAKAQDVE